MRNLRVPFVLLALLGILGCQTWRQSPDRFQKPLVRNAGEVFTFVIHSDPAGAEVFARQVAGGERRLGTTPLNLTVRMARGRKRNFGALFGKGDWQFYLPKDSPFVFSSNNDFISLRIPELRLRKNGYEQETFTGYWVFPESLKHSVSAWKSVPVARRYQKTIVFKNPTAERAATTVTIDCATGAAKIQALDAQGGAGATAGTTPLACRIGFAPERTDAGAIVSWRIWAGKQQDLWEVAPNGDLFLNAILEREGYAPEKVRRRICNFRDPPPEQQTAQFQMVRPTKPEAQFTLHLNSLPSEASVYVLNADGSLGREFGKTPLEFTVGVAQESAEDTPGMYVHKDWRLWAPVGLVRWDVLENGALAVKLTCAVYKDGFAVENVIHPIFELKPGRPYPQGLTLTVPLPSAEQAAVRESHRLQQARILSTVDDDREQPRRPTRVWQEPPRAAPAETTESRLDEGAAEKTPRRSWWGRLWHRDSRGADSQDDE